MIAILGIMPYIALQIKAVSTSFYLISGFRPTRFTSPTAVGTPRSRTGLLLAADPVALQHHLRSPQAGFVENVTKG